MTPEKAKEVKRVFTDSIETIKKESLGFYYIIQNYEYTSEVMREAARSIKIPLTVICSDSPPFEGTDSVIWKKCLETFAAGYSNRKYILAKNCSHYVFVDNPHLVIDEIIKQYTSSSNAQTLHSKKYL